MQRGLLQFGALLLLALCLWGHVSELFDHWDNTFRTGYDIEYNTVIVVLVAGAAVAFAHALAGVIRWISAIPRRMPSFTSNLNEPRVCAIANGHSPPVHLRI